VEPRCIGVSNVWKASVLVGYGCLGVSSGAAKCRLGHTQALRLR